MSVGVSDEVSEPESLSRRLIGQEMFIPRPSTKSSRFLDEELDIMLRRVGVFPSTLPMEFTNSTPSGGSCASAGGSANANASASVHVNANGTGYGKKDSHGKKRIPNTMVKSKRKSQNHETCFKEGTEFLQEQVRVEMNCLMFFFETGGCYSL